MHVNHKKVYRIYKDEGLAVRKRKRKKLSRERIPLPVPEMPDELWAMDFVADSMAPGRKFRVLNILDVCTREAVAQEPGFSLSGHRVAQILDRVCIFREKPKAIIVDNGPEFCSKALDQWAYENNVKLAFIEPGKPTQNAFIESFNGTFRDSCLNENWFIDMDHVKEQVENWRLEYNNERPHSPLGGKIPAEFKQQLLGNLSKSVVQV